MKGILLLTVTLALVTPARASGPSVAACLAASDASLNAANAGRRLDERDQLSICAATSCPKDIREECARRLFALGRTIPSVVFEVKDASGKALSDVQISVDGQRIAERLDGSEVLVEPGEHLFTFESPGQPTVSKRLQIHDSEKSRREIVLLVAPGPAPIIEKSGPPAAEPSPAVQASQVPVEPTQAPEPGLSRQKTWALVVGGVGVVGLGVGSAFGISALSRKGQAEQACPGERCDTPAGVTAWKDAAAAGDRATVAFIAGSVGIAAGAVLWFTAPRARAPSTGRNGLTPRWALGWGQIHVSGAF